MSELQVTTTSELPALPEAMWARVASIEGINHELAAISRHCHRRLHAHFGVG